ncbi:MAG: glycosyltransferase family 2 protein [Patescibacteria group bacterium]|nr:glycosyltransferase family 2 protein [Patescibacteria group bacterium]MDD4610456.1 glycosyltransferase family 2 protein [Patescibacteria group bacterium]
MNLSIIINNYNSKEKTLRCLSSIKNSDLPGLTRETIVVDNASFDGIAEELKIKFPEVKFIQSEKNLGMGGGNNLGIAKANGEFILILNPDIILERDSIKNLYHFLKNRSEIGLAAPKLLNPDGSLQYSCFREYKFFTPIFRRTFLGKYAQKHLNNFLMLDFSHNEPREVDWVMGSCILFKKEILSKIGGGFDRRYFMYFEDTDLCRRIRKNNLKVVYYPQSQVVHDHARESAKHNWFVAIFTNKLAREHIKSFIKYFLNGN